jgi:cytochrome b pre-mRNA-processing protein 3
MNSAQQGGIAARLRRLVSFGGQERAAATLYAEAVKRARRPELYSEYGVPDTPAGRYEMVAWQVLVQLAALAGQSGVDPRLGQVLVDRMFTDMDRALREIGVGDLSVGREMRKLGETWQARVVLAERVLPLPDRPTGPDALQELAVFLEKNLAGDDGGTKVDGAGLARDLMAVLQRLRAEG